jgi:predicted Zn-dependent peptidase
LYIIKELKNKINVIMCEMKYSNTVSIGFFIKAGTAYEEKYDKGISHMIEHMLFKGTKNRTAFDIACIIDNIGGDINAYTSKECTGIYSKVLSKDFEIPIEIISDMLMNSLFDEDDIKKEKSVIKEEIKSYEDSPEDINYDLLSEIMYIGTNLTHPILGTFDSVKKITKEEILKYMKEFYTSENMIISVAGNFDQKDVLKKLNNTIGEYSNYTENDFQIFKPIINQTGFKFKKKEFEQTHIDLAFWGPDSNSDLNYAAHVFNNVLAGTMSSRLFQKVREEKGLVYSIYSQISSYENAGNTTIGFSLSHKNLFKATEVVIDELLKIKEKGITIEEFENSKKHLIGNIVLNTETSDAYMSMMAKELLFKRKVKTVEEIIDEINNVSFEDVSKVIDLFFTNKKSVSSVGKIDKTSINKIYNLIIEKLEG